MQIGKGRPLAVFCWLLSIVAALYVCLDISVRWLLFAVIIFLIAAVSLTVVSLFNCKSRYILRYIAFLFLALFVGAFSAYARESRQILPAEQYAGQKNGQLIEVTGLVTSEEFYSHYMTCVGVQLDIPGGTKAKAYLTLTGEHDAHIGDRICAQATLYPVAQAPEEEWTLKHLHSEGYVLVGYVDGTENYQTLERDVFVLRQYFGRLQYRLSDWLTWAVGGEEGKLSAALLLGTKQELSDMTTLDFRRAGASHLLALSGLHLSLIVLAVDWLLRSSSCPFYLRIGLLSMIALLFLALTGFSISMLRATFMLLCLYLSRLRGTPHDSLTPLSLFLGIILTVQPTAVYDAGLWLTVLATFTLIEIAPTLLKRSHPSATEKRIPLPLFFLWSKLLLPILTSVLILVVLLLPMAIIFGEVSLLSPLSNLLLTPLTALILIFGMVFFVLFALGAVVPFLSFLSDIVARILHGFAGYMLSVAQWLSDTRGTLLSLRYPFVPWLLAIMVIALICFLLLKWKHPKRFWFVIAGWSGAFVLCLMLTHQSMAGQWEMHYVSNKKNELLCLSSDQSAVLFDITDGSYTAYREFLSDSMPPNATEIEALVLTHYHNRHVSTVYKLLGDVRVRTIWLPMSMPEVEQDKAIKDEGNLQAIVQLAKQRRVEVRYYLPNEGAKVTDGLTIEKLYYAMLKRSTHPTIALSLVYTGDDEEDSPGRIAWLGASAWESDYADEIGQAATSSDVLVFSKHGPVIKTTFTLTDWSRIPKIVFFTDGNTAKALEGSKEMSVVLKRAQLILGGEYTRILLP